MTDHILALVPKSELEPARLQQALRLPALPTAEEIEDRCAKQPALARDIGLYSPRVLAYALLAADGNGTWSLTRCDALDAVSLGEKAALAQLSRLADAVPDLRLATFAGGLDLAVLRYSFLRNGVPAPTLEAALTCRERHVDCRQRLGLNDHHPSENLAAVCKDLGLPDPYYVPNHDFNPEPAPFMDDLETPRAEALAIALLQLRIEMLVGRLSLTDHRNSIQQIRTTVGDLETTGLLAAGTARLIMSP